jgi:DNA (cytosine-5)-methyltransferase 1
MPKSKGEYHTLDKRKFITCVGHNFQAESGRIAMGIDWMTRKELSQAIPPVYTEWIGGQLIRICEGHRRAISQR